MTCAEDFSGSVPWIVFFFYKQLHLFLHLVHSSSNKPYQTWSQTFLLRNRLNNSYCNLIRVEIQNAMLFFKDGKAAVLLCSH